MTITCLKQRRDGSWVKVTLTRSHTRLRPAWREQGSTSWTHEGVDKFLMRRWHGEIGKVRFAVQVRPVMTDAERAVWVSPGQLERARKFA